MDTEMNPYIVYVRINSSAYITAVDSSAYLTDTTGWVEIDRGYGNRYRLAQGNYFPQPINTIDGACRYKLVDGKPQECTPEEIREQEEANKPVNPPAGTLEQRVTIVESDVASLTAAIEKGLML